MLDDVDFEKDHLVINRDAQGKFYRFRWYPSEKNSVEKMQSLIADWNETQKEKGDEALPAELIQDNLIREICAYKQNGQPLEDLIKDAGDVQRSIDDGIEYLETALGELKRIRGLD